MTAASALECLANRAEIGPRRVTAIAANLVRLVWIERPHSSAALFRPDASSGLFFESGPPMLIDKSS